MADINGRFFATDGLGGMKLIGDFTGWFTFNPDRHAVSSYFNCDDYYRVTPDQVRRIREHLMAEHRKALIAGQV
jgi:hypothetical protein